METKGNGMIDWVTITKFGRESSGLLESDRQALEKTLLDDYQDSGLDSDMSFTDFLLFMAATAIKVIDYVRENSYEPKLEDRISKIEARLDENARLVDDFVDPIVEQLEPVFEPSPWGPPLKLERQTQGE